MGVDFNNGSMSYPRYDNLITAIATCFNGIPNIEIPQDTDKVFYCFGYIDKGNNSEKKEKFIFDQTTPECIKKLCNNPYGDLTNEEVKELYGILVDSKSNILVVNEDDYFTINQFIRELEYCIEWCDSWHVS